MISQKSILKIPSFRTFLFILVLPSKYFKGFYCFGTELVGHGNSDKIEGLPVFIPDFKECRDDILDHIHDVKKFLETQYGQAPPLFILGHSMGKVLYYFF